MKDFFKNVEAVILVGIIMLGIVYIIFGEGDRYNTPCKQILQQRSRQIIDNQTTIHTDSLLVKLNCGCDTTKIK